MGPPLPDRVSTMAKNVVVQIVDDIDGGEAAESINFALDGKSYEIDLNAKNAAALRKAFAPFIDKARATSRGIGAGSGRSAQSANATLFSQLDAEEKDRFRRWANMPNARRIGDARVKEWTDAGRP